MARRGRQRGDRIVFCCPVHNDGNPSAEYRVSKGVWICRSCFAGGGLVTGEVPLARKLGIRSHSDPSRPIPVPPPPTPEPTESAMRARERLSGWFAARTGVDELLADMSACEWLEERGIYRATVENFGIGLWHCNIGDQDNPRSVQCLSIPWLDNYKTVGVQYRVLEPGCTDRYRWSYGSGHGLFNEEITRNPESDTVIVVEGALKAATVWTMGIPDVVAISNKRGWKPEFWGELAGYDRVIFALDPDAESEAWDAAEQCPHGASYVANFPEKPDDYASRCGFDPDCFLAITDCAKRAK